MTGQVFCKVLREILSQESRIAALSLGMVFVSRIKRVVKVFCLFAHDATDNPYCRIKAHGSRGQSRAHMHSVQSFVFFDKLDFYLSPFPMVYIVQRWFSLHSLQSVSQNK